MEKNPAIDRANESIGWIIRDEALILGYDRFFRNHVSAWGGRRQDGEGLREFAKRVTYGLPDWCSFSAFFAVFEDRFAAWCEAGNIDGIKQDQEDE